MELQDRFEECSSWLSSRSVSSSPSLDSGLLLRLYGLYKRATVGECVDPRPLSSWWGKHLAKWTSWKDASALSKEEAMSQYISLVEPMMSERSTDSGGLGRSVSRPEKAEHVRDDVCFWSGEGELQKIKDRLDEDPSLALFANQEGRTMLHMAADRGQLHVVEFLLQNCELDVNAQDCEGNTALHFAAVCDHKEICQLLLDHGAIASIANKDGEAALELL